MKYNLLLIGSVILLLTLSFSGLAQDDSSAVSINSDTTISGIDNDSVSNIKETPKSSLKTTIIYSARDSIFFNVKSQEVILCGAAKVNYGNITMEADSIIINYNTGLITATYTKDSLGRKIGVPHFIDDDDEYYAENIKYNYKNERGYVTSILSNQNEGWIRGHETVKNSDNVLFIRNGEFCPCEDSTETTYIRANKIKVVPEKRIVTGPAMLYIGDVPTPLIMPFGLFPATSKKTSGIIIPRQFGNRDDRGFYMSQGGYYWAVNDYLGSEFLGEIYADGSWGLGNKTTYKSRYKFDGNVDFNFRKIVRNGDEPRNRLATNEFKFIWNHSPKARGGKKFSANVDLGSTTYNRFNEVNTDIRNKNNMNSNISYFTPLGRKSPFSLSTKLRHSQNNQTGEVDLTLPDVSLNMARRMPFKQFNKNKKDMFSDFVRSIGGAYTMKFQNKINNKARSTAFPFGIANREDINLDFLPFGQENFNLLLDRMQYGVQHNIPLSASMKLGNSFTLNPSFNYTENWYPERYGFEYAGGDSVFANKVNGFNRASWYSASASVNTAYYMTYSFKGKSESKLRHVMRPSVSGNFSPDFTDPSRAGAAYTQIQSRENGDLSRVSYYQGMIYGYGGGAKQASMGVSLQNNFELKRLKKFNDTVDVSSISAKDKYQYIKLIENLSFSGNYNFAADSFQLSRINMVASTRLFNLFTIQGNATMDPYIYTQYVQNGAVRQRRINKLAWQSGQGVGQLERLSLSVGGTFNDQTFQRRGKGRNDNDVDDVLYNLYSSYVDFTVPWTLTLNYNTTYSRYGFEPSQIMQSLSFRGTLGLTPKWQLTYGGSYDFKSKQVVSPNLNVARDLGCWVMNFVWYPFGVAKSYNFQLHVKASMLKDLNIRRSQQYYDRAR